MKNYIIIILALLTATLVSCKRDTETFMVNSENVHTSKLVGIVTDENDEPIGGATISYKGSTTMTDEYGVYEIANVKVGDLHSVLSITKSGYFEGSRTIRTDKEAEIYSKTQLLTMDFDYGFNSVSGADFTADGVDFSFPSDVIVIESTGMAYSGDVKVAVKYIDPVDENSAFQMPGDLSAEGENGEIDLLRSFGMVAVELQSPSGEKLQVKEGSTVTMTADIPMEIQADAPSEIPMWHFNHSSGLWEKEGMAVKQGNAYVAEVPHFSYWNYDYQEESIILSGKLVDEDGNPVSAAHILISAEGAQWGGHGNTNLDGSFSGRVTKGVKLNVSLLGSGPLGCRNNRVFITQIGPFNTDTKIGDIVLQSSGQSGTKYLKVKGTLVDCNGDKVTKGFVRMWRDRVLVTDGTFNLSIPYCNARPTALNLVARDIKNLKESRDEISITSDNIDLGNVTVCDEDIQFIELKNEDLDINKLMTEEIFITSDSSNSSRLFGWSQRATLNIVFDAKDLKVGTYNITQTELVIGENNGDPQFPKTFAQVVSGEVKLSKNADETRWIGNYTVTLKDPPNGNTTFTGRFSLKI